MEAWKDYDATELVALGYPGKQPILIDVGTADANLTLQLKPEKFEEAAKKAGVKVRMAPSYFTSHHWLITQLPPWIRWACNNFFRYFGVHAPVAPDSVPEKRSSPIRAMWPAHYPRR